MACWPIRAKTRSRLHYFLADREAAAAETGARAVLAHDDGRISETSTANIAIVRDGTIVAPPAADALPGISLGFARHLAAALGITWHEVSLIRPSAWARTARAPGSAAAASRSARK